MTSLASKNIAIAFHARHKHLSATGSEAAMTPSKTTLRTLCTPKREHIPPAQKHLQNPPCCCPGSVTPLLAFQRQSCGTVGVCQAANVPLDMQLAATASADALRKCPCCNNCSTQPEPGQPLRRDGWCNSLRSSLLDVYSQRRPFPLDAAGRCFSCSLLHQRADVGLHRLNALLRHLQTLHVRFEELRHTMASDAS
jgi:hypothetical protein